MTFGITQEEMDLVTDVHDNHEEEFRKWADDNEDELMKWYDENQDQCTGLFTTACRFAYYCASKFMEYKNGNIEEA